MKTRMARMPRRYDATFKTLRRLMNSKSEKVQLQASMRMSEILLTLEQSNERREIAIERAAARGREDAEAKGAEQADTQTTAATAIERARAYLAKESDEN
jgi:hypothetical protein